jgi:uncharacterized protein involved in high-affinity Fe2+ transport
MRSQSFQRRQSVCQTRRHAARATASTQCAHQADENSSITAKLPLREQDGFAAGKTTPENMADGMVSTGKQRWMEIKIADKKLKSEVKKPSENWLKHRFDKTGVLDWVLGLRRG